MNKIIVTTPAELHEVVSEAIRSVLPKQEENQPEYDTVNLDTILQVLVENGYPTSKGKMYKLTSEGKIPHKVYNNKLVFSRKEVLAWAEDQAKPKHQHTDIIKTVARSARRKMR